MTERKPEDLKFCVSYTCSKLEYENNPERAEAYAREKLVRELAEHIVSVRAQKIEHDFGIERRWEVYVGTPFDFWRIVDREATRIAKMFMPRP